MTAIDRLLDSVGGATGTTNLVRRIGQGVAAIPPGSTRTQAEAVAAAAARLATASTDAVTEQALWSRFIEPTADLLGRFGRLAAEGPAEVRTELDLIAADFPRLAHRLETVAAELRATGGWPHDAGATAADPTARPRMAA